MNFTATDHQYMARALQLAERALCITSPNPRVGCVLVKNGQILGEGHTQPAGGHHAEIEALEAARAHYGVQAVRGATAYVTLEPCSHFGRTPPCCDALIAAGLAQVVAAMQDPNPQVSGQGMARLQAAGIQVRSGLLKEVANELNLGFVHRMTQGRPWVRLKMAASLDGRTALNNGSSQWITGAEARLDGHRWRARACAILTGSGTVLADDPQLNVRLPDVAAESTVRQPLKVLIDSQLQTPLNARLLDTGNSLIVTTCPDVVRRRALENRGAQVLLLPADAGLDALQASKVDLQMLMVELAQRGVNELHVEAGAGLSGALMEARLVDELLLYYAPTVLGESARGQFALAELNRLDDRAQLYFTDVRRLGADLRILARWQPEAENSGTSHNRV